jgi:hypothetical protein
MSPDPVRNEQPTDHLHPRVYETMIGLAAWFVLSAWVFFGTTGGYAAYAVVVVGGLMFVAVAIPVLIWMTWRRNRVVDAETRRADEEQSLSFRDWSASVFATWQGRLSGSEAAMLAILPIAAVAIGMMAIGTVFAIVSAGAA